MSYELKSFYCSMVPVCSSYILPFLTERRALIWREIMGPKF